MFTMAKPLAVVAVAWLAVYPFPAHACFAEGLAAFDGGDFKGAFRAWRPLAEAGDAEAQIALAELYRYGQGVVANYTQAFIWYRRAAESGHPVAQLNLGEIYLKGQGVARDPVAAYVWLSRAAGQGRVWAEARRRALLHELTAVQLAEAEAWLDERP